MITKNLSGYRAHEDAAAHHDSMIIQFARSKAELGEPQVPVIKDVMLRRHAVAAAAHRRALIMWHDARVSGLEAMPFEDRSYILHATKAFKLSAIADGKSDPKMPALAPVRPRPALRQSALSADLGEGTDFAPGY